MKRDKLRDWLKVEEFSLIESCVVQVNVHDTKREGVSGNRVLLWRSGGRGNQEAIGKPLDSTSIVSHGVIEIQLEKRNTIINGEGGN